MADAGIPAGTFLANNPEGTVAHHSTHPLIPEPRMSRIHLELLRQVKDLEQERGDDPHWPSVLLDLRKANHHQNLDMPLIVMTQMITTKAEARFHNDPLQAKDPCGNMAAYHKAALLWSTEVDRHHGSPLWTLQRAGYLDQDLQLSTVQQRAGFQVQRAQGQAVLLSTHS